jgi:hypothetical protein
MASRMRVTSFICGTVGHAKTAGESAPCSSPEWGNLPFRLASHLLSCPVVFRCAESADEYTRCLAPSPGFFGTPVLIEASPGQLSGDAGLLPIREFDERAGLTRAFAEAVDGPRATGFMEHSLPERAHAHVVGILAGGQDRDGHGNRLDS